MISLDQNQEQVQERTKELVEEAIAYGRSLQSDQTGYLHYFYHAQEEDKKDTIPFLENILFSLALLRSKIVENINEAKGLIDKLLCFQSSQGLDIGSNFPFYLHEFPQCRDVYVGIRSLAPLYWIIKHFGRVLGADLNAKLEKAVCLLIAYGQHLHQNQQLPYSISVRFGSALKAFGILWDNKEFLLQGEELLQSLASLKRVDSWYSTEYLGDMLTAFQMIDSNNENGIWSDFWKYLNLTWHFETGCYVGPCIKEEQRKEEPKPCLYDYFLSYYSKRFSTRLKQPNLYKLHTALIFPSLNSLVDSQQPCIEKGNYKSQHWILIKENKWAYSVLEKSCSTVNPQTCRTLTPFRLVWGDLNRLHSFVCSGFDQNDVQYSADSSKIELLFRLPSEANLDNRERQREINFYVDFHPSLKILVEGTPSSTFELGQNVSLHSNDFNFGIKFELVEGEGQFFGHVMRGNRSNQDSNKGDNRFKSYDWHLFLRSVRRKGSCLIRAQIGLTS